MHFNGKCLHVWWEGWLCSLEKEVKVLCQRWEEEEEEKGEEGGGGGEGERRDGVVCGGRLKECWLGCLQDGGGALIIIGAHLRPRRTLTALPPLT